VRESPLRGGQGTKQSETTIRQLLGDAGNRIDRPRVAVEARGPEVGADWVSLKSPETYVGPSEGREQLCLFRVARRMENTLQTYRRFRARLRLNQWALSGQWTVKREAAVLNRCRRTDRVTDFTRVICTSILGPSDAAEVPCVSPRVHRWPAGGQRPMATDVDDKSYGRVSEQRLLSADSGNPDRSTKTSSSKIEFSRFRR